MRTGPKIVTGGDRFIADGLTVALPNGEEIVRVPQLTIARGDRLLVTGPTGSGKTSLFRALGGVWPFGTGNINVPAGGKVLGAPPALLPSPRHAQEHPDLPAGGGRLLASRRR